MNGAWIFTAPNGYVEGFTTVGKCNLKCTDICKVSLRDVTNVIYWTGLLNHCGGKTGESAEAFHRSERHRSDAGVHNVCEQHVARKMRFVKGMNISTFRYLSTKPLHPDDTEKGSLLILDEGSSLEDEEDNRALPLFVKVFA